MRRVVAGIFALMLLVSAGCGSDSESAETTTDESPSTAPVQARLDAIGAAVDSWEAAGSLGEAQAAATEARSLVTGSDDEAGLLPNRTGSPGVASGLADCAAVERDVLGGSWDDPQTRWQILDDAIAEWSPVNNPFPSLPSHPQRIVGWATLTISSDSLDDAHEFAGHAQLHVAVSLDAVGECQ